MRIRGIAAALLMTAMTAMAPLSTAEAASTASYLFYFRSETSNANVGVSTKMIYINRDTVTDNVSLSLMPYFSDGLTYNAGDATSYAEVRSSFESDSEYVELGEIKKPDLNSQKAPFNVYDSYIAVGSNIGSKGYDYVDYNFISVPNAVMNVSGTSVDSVPLAYSSATVSKDAPFGRYPIRFRDKAYTDSLGETGTCIVYIRNSNFEDSGSVYPSGSALRHLNIVVSDRDFGDVNDDGYVDSSDAAMILNDYAQAAASKASKFEDGQKSAADVNTDSTCDSSDSAQILSYYAYKQANSASSVSLQEYLDK